KEKLVDQKVQKNPKLLTDAYKDLLKEYDVDFKDRDIKSVVEDKILNPEKLKQGGAQGGQSGMSQ
ncbi:peptidylprolyl isomerase, partial [Staphylococcus aureus]|nr:peptidylprolyl isomerase [Staphylococcus aureus]